MEIGAIVVVNLQGPREKMVGKLKDLSSSGITIRGVDVNSFKDWMNQFLHPQEVQAIRPTTIFFPMHRVVSCYLDEDEEPVPSFIREFRQRTNLELEEMLGEASGRQECCPALRA